MSRLKGMVFISAISGALVLGFLAWDNHQAARRARVAADEVRARIARHKTERQTAEQTLRARESAATEGARPAPKPDAAGLGQAAERPPAPPPPRRTLNILEAIRNEPDAEVLYLASRRAELSARYGPLLHRLGLGAEQQRRFQDIVMKREEQRMDLNDAARNGTPAEAAAAAKLQLAADADYEAAQRALLSEEGYMNLREYERSAMLRTAVSAIAGMSVVEKIPITATQADQLVAALASASASYRRGGPFHSADTDWERVSNEARQILSPAQFELFTSMDPGPTTPGLIQTRLYGKLMALEIAAKRAAAATGTK